VYTGSSFPVSVNLYVHLPMRFLYLVLN
jgi:hypothetical protein